MTDCNTLGGLHYEMMRRCYNPKCVSYHSYGAIGITVCDEWHDRETFKIWCRENGYQKGMRIDRKDSKKGYFPDNCFLGYKNTKKNGIARHTRKVKKHREKMKDFSGIKGTYSNTRIYRIYVGMHNRCEDIKNKHYSNYGGRGVSVCDEWSGEDGFFYFYKWSMQHGYTDKLSIDRINNDIGYSPLNCRWITQKGQIHNRRNSINFIYNGTKMNLSDIAKQNNVTYGRLYLRIVKKGMTLDEALNDIKNGTE